MTRLSSAGSACCEPALSEPMVMARVVQEMAKLSLIKLDVNAYRCTCTGSCKPWSGAV